ncbi:hypothetical protein N7495_009524 [Penicillium taxi]|uniref:uncharacterized protein n=1 Tax=Penicillium taxi TaxID=168475 RepID=UPI0025452ADC|nr:uncharacterized protein N7495_009524 [Penicillium taxi]KAJ5885014.1 hypothetical protein N7495_009524 [Penicillium taxi]
MNTVESLVDRARHISLNPVDKFHATLDSHLQNIYESLTKSPDKKAEFLKTADVLPTTDPLVSLDAFRAYMKDAASCAQAPAKQLDVSAPISDYYISSSHNTYLTGNQLYSDAAASAYTSVLLRGCRSVEIDVWDGETEDSDSSDSESSSDDAKEKSGSLKSKVKGKLKSKLHSEASSGAGLKHAVSSRLEEALQRREATRNENRTANSASNQQLKLVEPRVLHGYTLTKGTTFREICHAIRDSAFVVSDLPVIVSLEIHACLEQQQMMVDIMKDIWKGLLVEVPEGQVNELPTLGQLRRKILVKTKSLPLPGTVEKPEVPKTNAPELTENVASTQLAEDETQKPAKPSKVLEALAQMAVYTQAYHFSQFEQPEAKIPVHIFSLSENAAREAHENQRAALFEHNRVSMMRIFPYAFRVTSSNLDPSFFWRRGAQIVALNWQKFDKGMMLNEGMFCDTPGWELKPPGYRSSESSSDIIARRSLDLTIEIFAAQDLSLPQGDHGKWFNPYVNCQLHVEEPDSPVATGRDDASSDEEKSSYRRCTKKSAGTNPDFKGQKLEFPTVAGVIEELSFVRLKIKDEEIGRDSLAAWACIRLDRLREGYRLLHLRDRTGAKAGGVLLVHVTKRIS